MLTQKVKETAAALGISELGEKVYNAVSNVEGVHGVTFDFSQWEPDYPCIKVIVRYQLPAGHTLRERHRIVRPVEKSIKSCGLLQAQGYSRYRMDKEHLIFYYRMKTKDDYTLYASDFSSFVPTVKELQQLQAEFISYDGDKEAFLHDFQVHSWKHNFFDDRGKEIARLMDQLLETEKRHREELAAKDSLIADLRKALEKTQNS